MLSQIHNTLLTTGSSIIIVTDNPLTKTWTELVGGVVDIEKSIYDAINIITKG